MNEKTFVSRKVYEDMLSLIPTGEENAVHTKELCKALHRSTRDLRKYMELARRDGILICASDFGYYYPSDVEEVKKYVYRNRQTIQSLYEITIPFVDYLNSVIEGGFSL